MDCSSLESNMDVTVHLGNLLITTRGVQNVLQIDIQKINKALEFYFI